MYLVQMLLPCADNDGRPFEPALFERLKQELAEEFTGVTAYLQAPADGLWKEEGAKASRDDIVIFEVMVEKVDLARWRIWRKRLEQRFRQEKVVIRHWATDTI